MWIKLKVKIERNVKFKINCKIKSKKGIECKIWKPLCNHAKIHIGTS